MTVCASIHISLSSIQDRFRCFVETIRNSRYVDVDLRPFAEWVDRWSFEAMDDQTALTVFRKAFYDQDQQAWREIWNQYHGVVFRKIRRELEGWILDGEEIRDITQTVFIKFWEDSKQWKSVDRLYTEGKNEGILSRLHSTAVYTVQRYRQTLIRKWIPCIRENYRLCSESERVLLQNLARDRLDSKYREIFLLHLRDCENTTIANLMQIPARDVSIRINRAWERYVYVLLMHRQQNPGFDPLFQHLISARREVQQ